MTSTTPASSPTPSSRSRSPPRRRPPTPIRDNGVQTSSPAGTSSAPAQDVRTPDNGVPAQQPQTMKPVVIETQPAPVKDDGPSPLIFILPSLALIGMLAAATVYVRSSRQPART